MLGRACCDLASEARVLWREVEPTARRRGEVRPVVGLDLVAMAGAHVATVPYKVLKSMISHPLTDKGIATFKSDWEKARKEMAVAR